jgi:TAT (twin-arginine translocation) pathway signal sequence.
MAENRGLSPVSNNEERSMSKFSRRDFLKTTAGAAAAGTLGAGSTMWSQDAMAQAKWTPEKGATLRVLRWKRFVQGDEDKWLENTKKFTGRPASRCASTAKAGRTCARRRRCGERRAAARTSSSRPSRMRTSIPDKLVDVTTSATTSAASTAAGTTCARTTASRRASGSRYRWAAPATPSCTASAR